MPGTTLGGIICFTSSPSRTRRRSSVLLVSLVLLFLRVLLVLLVRFLGRFSSLSSTIFCANLRLALSTTEEIPSPLKVKLFPDHLFKVEQTHNLSPERVGTAFLKIFENFLLSRKSPGFIPLNADAHGIFNCSSVPVFPLFGSFLISHSQQGIRITDINFEQFTDIFCRRQIQLFIADILYETLDEDQSVLSQPLVFRRKSQKTDRTSDAFH